MLSTLDLIPDKAGEYYSCGSKMEQSRIGKTSVHDFGDRVGVLW